MKRENCKNYKFGHSIRIFEKKNNSHITFFLQLTIKNIAYNFSTHREFTGAKNLNFKDSLPSLKIKQPLIQGPKSSVNQKVNQFVRKKQSVKKETLIQSGLKPFGKQEINTGDVSKKLSWRQKQNEVRQQQYFKKKKQQKKEFQQKFFQFIKFKKFCLTTLNKKYYPKKHYKKKKNTEYSRLLKNYVSYPNKLKVRFLYKFILVSKKAFFQYFQNFGVKNFRNIYKLYRTKQSLLTRFEKFINFFEFRLPCTLLRIRYTYFLLHSNIVILTGHIRVNQKVITFCDYQIRLFDIIEISYRAFFRQFFRRYLYRRLQFFQKRSRITNMVFYKREKNFFYLFPKYLARFPKWLVWGVIRIFRGARAFFHLLQHPSNDYFVTCKNVLATIIYKLPTRFKDRQFRYFMTKKQMKFFSNFCTTYI